MIKIPLSKYNNGKDKSLIELHYNNIEKHIIDVIQIYINCFNKINNIAYVSIYEYKKYYLWLLDKNDIVSDYIEINTKDIKK